METASKEEKEERRGCYLERRMEDRKRKYQMNNNPKSPLCSVWCVFPHERFTSDNSQWAGSIWRQVKVLTAP